MNEFTFDVYRNILKKALDSEYRFVKYEDFDSSQFNQIILRHDIDFDIEVALKLAEIEHDLGITAVYFIQPNCDFYNPVSRKSLLIIRQILNLGHVIGLHIDNNDIKDSDSVYKYVSRSHNFYSKYFELTNTVSFHRPSKDVLNNKVDLKCYRSTYASEYFYDIHYISDSNRRLFFSDLLKKIETGENIQFLTHPLWWKQTNMLPNDLKRHVKDVLSSSIEVDMAYNFKIFKGGKNE